MDHEESNIALAAGVLARQRKKPRRDPNKKGRQVETVSFSFDIAKGTTQALEQAHD